MAIVDHLASTTSSHYSTFLFHLVSDWRSSSLRMILCDSYLVIVTSVQVGSHIFLKTISDQRTQEISEMRSSHHRRDLMDGNLLLQDLIVTSGILLLIHFLFAAKPISWFPPIKMIFYLALEAHHFSCIIRATDQNFGYSFDPLLRCHTQRHCLLSPLQSAVFQYWPFSGCSSLTSEISRAASFLLCPSPWLFYLLALPLFQQSWEVLHGSNRVNPFRWS